MSNKNIPSAEYVQNLQQEYSEIIKRDHPTLAPDRLALLEEYAAKGTVKKQGQALPEVEQVQIKEAALETRKEFSKIFSSHKDKMLTAGPNVILEENLQNAITDFVAKNLQKEGYVIDPVTKKELDQLTKEKIKLLDIKSVNADNLQALGGDFLEELSKESPRLLVLKTLKTIEKDNGTNISESQAQKIVDKLSPALAKLDSEYLKQNSSIISGEIQKEVLAKSTVTSNMLGGVYIRESNLDKVANKLSEMHFNKSDSYQISLIEGNLYSRGLKDSEISAKLTDLGVEKAKALKYDVNSIPDQDLVQMRKENPVQFDKVVFGQDNPIKNPQEVINSVIDKTFDKLKKESGVKLSPAKEAHLKEKFTKQLTPSLSKLDPEYLKGQSDIISSNIQKELYKNKSIGYRFGKEFSVSTASLVTVSNSISAENQERSNQFEVKKVQSSLVSLGASNTQFEQRLTDLAVAKAKEVVFSKKDMNAEKLLEM
ncbi:MAG: hypothetical protein AB8B68_03270 [Rickettsiaceae bacterium]